MVKSVQKAANGSSHQFKTGIFPYLILSIMPHTKSGEVIRNKNKSIVKMA
uniref:Uncharacterized protein n=1 Tax=Anguilla anguilla TaxID=7936 RepID=A0A0E9SI76_ANGAN